ncbi:MAG: hypothetical protein VW362_07735 [Candidatus Nanopelagicales bacterium]
MITTAEIIASVEANEWLVGVVLEVVPSWAGLAPSEMLAMLATLEMHGVDSVVESGRHEGASTEALLMAGIRVHSVDIAPIPETDKRIGGLYRHGVRLYNGDGRALAPQLVRPRMDGLLVDGPKDQQALDMVARCDPRVAFVHDMHGGNPVRREMRGWWFSDDPEWVEYSRGVDGEYWVEVVNKGTAWKRGPFTSGAGSYGPTLAIMVRSQ